ncbi:MAG: glycosyltransferase, partial [Longimicrobiales bacterium]
AELRRLGHEVMIAYLYGYGGDGVLPLGPGDLLLNGDERNPLETLIGVRPALLQRLRRVIREFRPDIIQVNGARTVKYGTLVQWLRGDAAGAVVYRNIGSTGDWVRGLRRKVFYRMIMGRLDGTIAISRTSLEAMRPGRFRRAVYAMIPNGIDPHALTPAVARAALRESAGAAVDDPVAVYLGSLVQEKRVDRAIEAVRLARRSVPGLQLWIVGDGPLRGALEEQVEKAGIRDAVHFFGTQDDVASYLLAADMLLLVSDTEGVPAVVLEAGYLGRPVIATRVGGIAECVLHERTGLLVERRDADALVAAITRLATNPRLRATLGEQARGWVADHFTMSKVAALYLEFYHRVLARDQAARALAPVPAKPALDDDGASGVRLS